MMNRRVSANSPKEQYFSSTNSFKNRIDFLIMRDSLREYEAVNMVSELLGTKTPLTTKNYLIVQDTANVQNMFIISKLI